MPKGKRKRKKFEFKQGLKQKLLNKKVVGPYTITLFQETMDGALVAQPYVVSAIARGREPLVKRVKPKGRAYHDYNLMIEVVQDMIEIESN